MYMLQIGANSPRLGLLYRQNLGRVFSCIIWAASREKDPNVLSHCHTERRILLLGRLVETNINQD